MKYWAEVTLTMSGEVEADSPQEAFDILSDAAISGGDWGFYYEKEQVEDEEE